MIIILLIGAIVLVAFYAGEEKTASGFTEIGLPKIKQVSCIFGHNPNSCVESVLPQK